MVELQSVEIELRNARRARINAELACCDVEELAAEIRQSHHAFISALAPDAPYVRTGRRRGLGLVGDMFGNGR